jgi:hypothetical protein
MRRTGQALAADRFDYRRTVTALLRARAPWLLTAQAGA